MTDPEPPRDEDDAPKPEEQQQAESAPREPPENPETATPRELGKLADESTEADGEARSSPLAPDPRVQATDESHAREMGVSSSAIADALIAIFGGHGPARGSANLFLGTTYVGSAVAGSKYGSGHSGMDQTFPSGKIADDTLDRIAATFVEPQPVYDEMREALERQRLLLLDAPPGVGRTSLALTLLHRACAGGVSKLDPSVDLTAVRQVSLADNNGYLVETLDVAVASRLRAYHAEQLTQQLSDKGCMLVVIVERRSIRHSGELLPFLRGSVLLPDPAAMIRKHLSWHQGSNFDPELLARPEIEELCAEMQKGGAPAREVAQLAIELADLAVSEETLAVVSERHSAAAMVRFTNRFADVGLEQKAFMIALAVFNGMPLHIVSRASRELMSLFRSVEVPDKKKREKVVFGTERGQQIEQAQAELFDMVENTEYGPVAVQSVRFRDGRIPRKLLEHVWEEYDEAHELVRTWLWALGEDLDRRVAVRAGVAVGLLSRLEFDHSRQLAIEPWADSGSVAGRYAAVGALQVPARQPELAPLVAKMLRAWLRGNTILTRKVTGIKALGSLGALFPDRALRLLRSVADVNRTDAFAAAHVALAVSDAMSELFIEPTMSDRVLEILVHWSDANRRHTLRDTGLLCVLQLFAQVTAEVERTSDQWPVAVWLYERGSPWREQVVKLLGRLLNAAYYSSSGFEQIRRWTRMAERDETLRTPLGQMMATVAADADEFNAIRFYFETWRDKRGGPAAAARVVLDVLDGKGDPV